VVLKLPLEGRDLLERISGQDDGRFQPRHAAIFVLHWYDQ
jgi:hypothetical protein